MRLRHSFLSVLVLVACTHESYETGDTAYSYLRADFVEAHTIAPMQVDYAVSDEGKTILFSSCFSAEWATKEDSLYRGLLYYNQHPDGTEPIRLTRVYVLRPTDASQIDNVKTDPVNFESAWISADGRYLNISFFVKTGKSEDPDAVQSIHMMSHTEEDGTLCMTLLHNQAGIPEYYSTRVYASVPLDGVPRNLRLIVNTYGGQISRDYKTGRI